MGLRRRRRKIVSEQPHLESVSASNGIVSFSTDFEAPIDKIVIPISPKQDLHGYDHPWPAGGDVNLSDYTNSENWRFASSPTQRAKTRSGCTITSSSGVLTMTRNSNLVGLSIILGTLSGGIQYTLSYIATNTDNFAYIAKLDTEIADNYTATRVFTLPATTVGNAKSVTFTPEDDGIYEVLLWSLNSSNITLQKLMLQKGETATSYRPYANICPIEGLTGVNIYGRNGNIATFSELLPRYNTSTSGVNLSVSNGKMIFSGTATASGSKFFGGLPTYTQRVFLVKAGVNYCASSKNIGDAWMQGNIAYDDDTTSSGWIQVNLTSGDRKYRTFTPDKNGRIAFLPAVNLTSGQEFSATIEDIQLTPEITSVYKGEAENVILPINWQTKAGTIYGGMVTLNEDWSADVVATHGYDLFDGSSDEFIAKYNSGSASAFAMTLRLTRNCLGNLTRSKLSNIRSNYLRTLATSETWGNYNSFVSVGASARLSNIQCGIKTITTVADFKAYLAENPLQIVYLLYTPITYHFDSIAQLKTFLGENNIWIDQIDNFTLRYWKKD